MYDYNAVVTRVVDGDTIDVTIDLGFSIFIKERVRLARINAPESRTRDLEEKQRGILATEALKDMLRGADTVMLRTYKAKGKYGRFVADVLLQGVNLNDMMVDNGFAVYKEY